MNQGVFAIAPGKILLRWLQENPSYKFNLYCGNCVTGLGPGSNITNIYNAIDFDLCRSNITAGSGPYNELILDGLTTGTVYFFFLRAVSLNGEEGPNSIIQGVRVI